jgi:hypothetical protein
MRGKGLFLKQKSRAKASGAVFALAFLGRSSQSWGVMTTAPLSSIPVPDYRGGSLLNLMSSIIRGLGGKCPHAPLRALPPTAVKGHRQVILLLLDGMGAEQIEHYLSAPARRSASPFLAQNAPLTIMDTVSPATTASVVTTVATGASPAEHGIIGWHLHFPDLGTSGPILPYRTRTGVPLAEPDFPLAAYLRLPSPLSTLSRARHLVSVDGIPNSPTSMAQGWWSTRRSFTTLLGLHRHLLAIARERAQSFTYAYWSHYDSVCHEFGPTSPEAVAHLAELDRFLARLQAAFRKLPKPPLLLVIADHGLMAVERVVNLLNVPGLYATFASLPAGDARCVHLFLRPDRINDALAILSSPRLAGTHTLLTGAEYLSSGLMGPGRPHPALASRVGDYVMLGSPGVIFQFPAPYSKVFRFLGHHSGLTTAETRIPLFALNV